MCTMLIGIHCSEAEKLVNSPHTDHVLVAIHSTLQYTATIADDSSIDKRIHWNEVGALGIDGNISIENGVHHEIEREPFSDWVLYAKQRERK